MTGQNEATRTTTDEGRRSRPSVVDTHVHFWDRRRGGLVYDWLADDAPPSSLGDLDGLRAVRYSVDEYRAETRFQGVTKVVHMNAATGTPGPVAETAWLQSLADRTGWPQAIIATCDLADASAQETIERHLVHGNLRGFREMRPAQILDDPAFRRGYGLLAGRGLVFCHQVGWPDWTRARDLVRLHPDVVFCLDQSGMPEARDPEYFAQWRAALVALAVEPNVVCKISSLGMKDPHWTTASRRPWILGCIEAFGADRCFFGSNWPVERLQRLRGCAGRVSRQHRRLHRGGAGTAAARQCGAHLPHLTGRTRRHRPDRSAYARPRWRPAAR